MPFLISSAMYPALLCLLMVLTKFAAGAPESNEQASLSVSELRCEMQAEPLNVETTSPRLSWILSTDQRGTVQRARHVLVATSPDKLNPGMADLWDSGRVTGEQSIHVEYHGKPLRSNQRAYWTIKAWDNADRESSWATPSQWTTAILDKADWKAQWISTVAGPETSGPKPLFRKVFTLSRPVKRATIHICGLGQHKLLVNGHSASENFLDPAWAYYQKTCYYSTYDITARLREGKNAFGVMLAGGWYDTTQDRRTNQNFASRPLALIVQAHVEYQDGSAEQILSDGSWSCKEGPYTHTSILGGVDYDARLLESNWADTTATAQGWNSVRTLKPEHGVLTAAIAPPMMMFQELPVKSITEPEPGRYVYDFGQNASATPRLRVSGKPGDRLRLTYAEERHGNTPAHNNGKGLVDQTGIRTPNYLEYTLRGNGEESWFPDFFYSGYQYIELTGAVPQGHPNPEQKPVVTHLASVHVHTDATPVGSFHCSDTMYERIDTIIDWAVRSNMAHVFTDCPQREKMGWLEQSHLMWPSVASRYDFSRFGAKITRDIRDSQGADGIVYTVAPVYSIFQGPFHYSPEYSAAAVLVPWYHYQWYGDKRILQDNYDCMRRYVDYMTSTSTDLRPVAGLGDWYDYGHGKNLGVSHFTPVDLSAMCIFSECAQALSQSAKVLGKPDDANKYSVLVDRIREAFNRHFRISESEYRNSGSPQTANAMALVTGQVEPASRKPFVDQIVRDIKQRGWLQTSGDIGFHYLVRALTQSNRHDVIFAMLAREELGSYRYLVNAGWTTMPESWNAVENSMNHCMLGHISEWFSQDLGGIKPIPGQSAFREFQLCPVVDGPVTSASSTLRSPYGEIRCEWQREYGKLTLAATVPVNSHALLQLPAAVGKSLKESGQSISSAKGIQSLSENATRFQVRLGSGRYVFTADYQPRPFQKLAVSTSDTTGVLKTEPRTAPPVSKTVSG